MTDVRIERTLPVPPATVWRMWTEPTDFEAWWGPDGVEVTVLEMDVRVGGKRLVRMAMQGRQMWFTGEHLEVTPDARLVYTEAMVDEQGAALVPGVTQVVVELAELPTGTRMVLTHVGVPADSPGASGWTMAFAKLEDHLARV